MRKIPATMATQHPDNANAPYWDERGNPFIGVHKEIKESVICFEDLGVSEFMWDWEGKNADAGVINKFFSNHYEYFLNNQLGQDKFLTFRIPNIWEEKGYSLMQAMTVILSGEDLARDLDFPNRPLFEVILPMTERADQLMRMHELFEKLADFKSSQFNPNDPANNNYLEIIPLTESVESQQGIRALLEEYVRLHTVHFSRPPEYIRPFLARSDPALVSGLLATVLGNTIAVSEVYEFANHTKIPVYPISGVGSLPFRGGLTPDTVGAYIKKHPGIRTVSLQSSFRYDHPKAKVKAAVKELETGLVSGIPHHIIPNHQKQLKAIGKQSAEFYRTTLNAILPDMQDIFAAVPARRERRQHIGLLAYGRTMGTVKLPRAITFTAGFYSIGVPPEFIGLGRTLDMLKSAELELVRDLYGSLQETLDRAGRYLNNENLELLAQDNSAWKEIQKDIRLVENILGMKFGPLTVDEKAHKNLTSNVLVFKKNPAKLEQFISETAVLRGSLG